MADANIVIGVKGETAGARRVKRSLGDVEKSGDRAKRSIGLLQSALVALGGAAVLRGFAQLTDRFTTLETQLRNVTSTTREYDKVFNNLFSIAQKNGDVFEGLGETFVKLNVSLNDSVKQSTDLVKVTEILSRGFAASGAAASTAAGATLQLTQGLATDFKAAGQELNSIIEGAPLLAKTIAVELGGKGATDLKRFAREGELTAESFLKALVSAEDAIKSFDIPPTIGRSVQRVKNAFLRFVGESDNIQGAATNVAGALDVLATSLDEIFRVLTVLVTSTIPLAVAALAKRLPAAIGATIAGFKSLSVVIAANPIGAIATAIALAVSGFIEFRDEILTFLDSFKIFGVTGAEAFFIIKNTVIETAKAIPERFKLNMDIARAEFKDFANDIKRMASKIPFAGVDEPLLPSGANAKIPRAKIEKLGENTSRSIANAVREDLEQLRKIGDEGSSAFDKAKEKIDETKEGVDKLGNALESAGDSVGRTFTGFVTGAQSASSAVQSLAKDIIQLVARQTITAPISSAVSSFASSFFAPGSGAASGGSAGIPTPTATASPVGPGFASGGSFSVGGRGGVDMNQLSLNGSPVARVSRGEEIKVNSQGDDSPTVNVNVINNTDAGVNVRETKSGNGGKSLEVVIDEAVARNIGTSGTKTSRALRDITSGGVSRR